MGDRIPILPDWNKDSPYYQWANNFVWRNEWRVQHLFGCDKEDMMGECALMWIQCCRRYGDTINSPQQMMYLYKLWVTGQFHDFATKDTKERTTQALLEVREELGEISELNIKMAKSSCELKQVLDIIQNAPVEIMDVIKKDLKQCTVKQLFRRVSQYCGFGEEKADQLISELQKVLS